MNIRFLNLFLAYFTLSIALDLKSMKDASTQTESLWQAIPQRLSTSPRDIFDCFTTTGKVLRPDIFSQDNMYINFCRTDRRFRDTYPQEPIENLFSETPTAPKIFSDWADCLTEQNPDAPSADHDIYADMLLACAFCDYNHNIFPHDIYAMFDHMNPDLSIDEKYGTECIDHLRMQQSPAPRFLERFDQFISHFDRLFNFSYDEMLKDPKQLRHLKKTALKALACTYKIHLQVKPEYLIALAQDIIEQMGTNGQFGSIYSIKITTRYVPGLHLPARESEYAPVFVLYLWQFFCNHARRDGYMAVMLGTLITAINERYGPDIAKISLPVAPRFSQKINDLVYIAGGEGVIKAVYKELLDRHYLPHNTVFEPDPDMFFIKGFGYHYQPVSLPIPLFT